MLKRFIGEIRKKRRFSRTSCSYEYDGQIGVARAAVKSTDDVFDTYVRPAI